MSLSSVSQQVMWNRLISVVEEQAQALIRTAFSTSVREAGDLSAGVYNKQGLMLAQAVTGTPGHVNAMAESVKHFIREIGPENIFKMMSTSPMTLGRVLGISMISPSHRQLFTRASMWAFLPVQHILWILVVAALARMLTRFTKRVFASRL